MTYHDFVARILEVITYADDREEFISRFMATVQLQTVTNLRETLNSADQANLDDMLTVAGSDSERVKQALGRYFTQAQIHELSSETALEEIAGFLGTIQNTLSDSQEQELDSLVGTLQYI